MTERRPDGDWYRDAVIYELHVRAFADSDGDGIGDFKGLTARLDYLEDLGVTALWLLPFYPSPLKDDGYDIADYTAVNPAYGSLDDFRELLVEAHRRGLKVITELVLNHTSSEHPWFQRARRAPPGSVERDFYVWSQTADRYQDARIIFKDFETSNWNWDPLANAYYWHRFYGHQPDLNLDNPAVHEALFRVVDFWLELGVDGLRLDAVPYLYEREGTSCENLSETHAFLRSLRAHIDARFPGRMLLAEANQWPEDAVAYFGKGDECHMAFHFPLMPRMFMALELKDRFPLVDIMEQTPGLPEGAQWALFLRNHDELTLEMVTDEDRDYMYRTYARDPQARINLGIRRRLAPLLKERRKIELMKALLLSLPGTPVLYYGDEIGMGDNIYLGDRNGVRTPMQWSSDKNAGFSRSNPQRLFLPVIIDPEYHYEAVNVEAQQQNASSLLWWTKRCLALRREHAAFGRGELAFVGSDNHKMLSFVRQLGDQVILVVVNLSRFAQAAELDLSRFQGRTPIELFGETRFPTIGAGTYPVTLGPHGFFWFSLQKPRPTEIDRTVETPVLQTDESWLRLLDGRGRALLEEILPSFLQAQRWFRGKESRPKGVEILDVVSIGENRLLMVEVTHRDQEPEHYVLPLGFADAERAARLRQAAPQALICRVEILREGKLEEGALFDAALDAGFGRALLVELLADGVLAGRVGRVRLEKIGGLEGLQPEQLEPHVPSTEQSHTSIFYDQKLIVKLLRRVEAGESPEIEMQRFLARRAHAARVAPLVGHATYEPRRGPSCTIAVAHSFVPNQGDAWKFTLDALSRYFDWAAAHQVGQVPTLWPSKTSGAWREPLPELAAVGIGSYLASAQLLGQRVAELHLALKDAGGDPAFTPEPFTLHYQRSLYEHFRTRGRRTLRLLETRLRGLPESAVELGRAVLERERALQARQRRLLETRVATPRQRIHGDLHLGQVLHTGNDFVIIDFEGEPGRALPERRFKRPALADVAGMLRSFHYAASVALLHVRHADVPSLSRWAEFWRAWVSNAFLRAYLEYDGIPRQDDETTLLLDLFLLDKALYEVTYELNYRPGWVSVPLQALLGMLGTPDR